MLLSATRPSGCVRWCWGPFARYERADDHPFGMPGRRFADTSTAIWTPSAPVRWSTAWHRVGRTMPPSGGGPVVSGCGGPGYFRRSWTSSCAPTFGPVLESIQAPTLVLHRRGDRHVVAQHAQDVADRIPDARLVEFDGDDAWFAGDADRVLDEIEPFITGSRRAIATNRVLSTVLFTDIVGSTERTQRRWGSGLGDGPRRPRPHRGAPCRQRPRLRREVHRRRSVGDIRWTGAGDRMRDVPSATRSRTSA